MAQNNKVLKVISDAREKYTTTTENNWESAFGLVFEQTKSKCREIVLKYREEAPDVAPHVENVSNQILANIVSIKNKFDTQNFKNEIRLGLLSDLERDIIAIPDESTAAEKKPKKVEKKEQ